MIAESIDIQRNAMLHGFKQVTKALGKGFAYYIKDKNGETTTAINRTPALAADLIHKIYDMAISDSDYESTPISKKQILGIALKAANQF